MVAVVLREVPKHVGNARARARAWGGKRPALINPHAALVKQPEQQPLTGQIGIDQFDILDGAEQRAAFGPGVVVRNLMHNSAFRRIAGMRVGLARARDALPGELTYIDQKRLELARALALQPDLLLLDEWLAGLNPTELDQGIALIQSLRGQGITILLVEHVMDAIRSLCDRCLVMNTGRLIASGLPNEVLADPEVIRAYLGDDDA